MNWNKLDIGAIEFYSRSHTLKVLREIFESLLRSKKTIVLIRYASDVLEMLRINNNSLLARPGVTVFGCASIKDIELIIDCIDRIHPWHATEFCALIGSSDLAEEITSRFKSYLSHSKKHASLWYLDGAESVSGIIQPLDDDFGISGDAQLKKLVEPIIFKNAGDKLV